MNWKNLIGAFLCAGLFVGAFLSGEGWAHYLTAVGALIVL